MSVAGSLDAIAVKAETMTGLKRCYSASGQGVSAAIRPIPRGIEDGPVGIVWIGSGRTEGGNSEHVIVDTVLDIWVQAASPGYAYKTLVAFCDLARTAFRADMNLGGEATRCIFTGWDEPETERVNDKDYLVLPIRLETTIVRLADDASA
jgi:hypothetical protein